MQYHVTILFEISVNLLKLYYFLLYSYRHHQTRSSLRRSHRLSTRLGLNSSGNLRLGGQGSADGGGSSSNATELSRTGAAETSSHSYQVSLVGTAVEGGSVAGQRGTQHTRSSHTPFSISDLLLPNSERRRRSHEASHSEERPVRGEEGEEERGGEEERERRRRRRREERERGEEEEGEEEEVEEEEGGGGGERWRKEL